MNLQNSSLDYLIPRSVVEMANLDQFVLDLDLEGTAAAGRFPQVRVWVNKEIVWQGTVEGITKVHCKKKVNAAVSLQIEYYNKSDADTIVDAQGQIVENQNVRVAGLVLNDIDVITTQSVYRLGHYYMKLSPEKETYFRENGFTVEPNHSLQMFENGEWKLDIPFPVVSNLASLQSLYEKHEVWIDPQEEVYKKIYQKILNIRQLQQKIKEAKCNSKQAQ